MTLRRSCTCLRAGSSPATRADDVALRTDGDPLRHVAAVRQIVREADGRVPVTNFKTQAADIDQTINQEIVFARLCSAFAILALVIACVGLYATMAYAWCAARVKSESVWRWEPDEASSSGWCCARSVCSSRSGSRSAADRPRLVSAHRIVSVRHEAQRPSGADAGGGGSRDRGAPGRLRSGPKGVASRSVDGPAARLTRRQVDATGGRKFTAFPRRRPAHATNPSARRFRRETSRLSR